MSYIKPQPLTKPQATLSNMAHLLSRYNAFLIDIWGVVHNGTLPYPGVIDCLNQMMDAEKTVLFLSNAPRPASVIIQKLIDFGIKTNADRMITSGDVVRTKLQNYEDTFYNHPDKRIFHLGHHRNLDILHNIPAILVDRIADADVMLLSAFVDENEDLHQFDPLLKEAAALKIPAICANPDKALMNDNKTRYCAGVFAEKFEAFGGLVQYYGKPHLPIYDSIFKKLENDGIYNKTEILMIGDTLETDILGANQAGIDSALVLTGNTEFLLEKTQKATNEMTIDRELQSPQEKTAVLTPIFNSEHIFPTWIIPGLFLNDNQ